MADIVWLRTQEYKIAPDACKAYLRAALKLEHPLNWVQPVIRIERSLQIASKLGRNQQLYSDTIISIEQTLDRLNGEDPLFFSARLMELLIEQRRGDFAKLAALAEKAALRAETATTWYVARNYWAVNADWHHLEKDATAEHIAKVRLAETYVQEAEQVLRNDPPNYLVASSHLQSAIQAYRGIGNERARIDTLHVQLLSIQKESVKQLKRSGVEIPIDDLIERSVNAVKDKPLWEALGSLAMLASSPDKKVIRDQVEEIIRLTPLSSLLMAELLSDEGKVTQRQPSLISGNSEQYEQALRIKMFHHATAYHGLHVNGCIEPARNRVGNEHLVRVRDFMPLTQNNLFVPQGREYLFAKGLFEGLNGDFVSATSILIPQMENAIRNQLYQNDIIASTFSAQEGIQDEMGLNRLFELYRDTLVAIFGEDTAFDLEGLLIERSGSNLRNLEAHGLLSQEQFYSVPTIYFWWLTLRICYLFKISATIVQETHDTEDGKR